MKYQPYPAYKPSGIEWLGEIPEHWEFWRLKNIARFGYGDSLAANDRVPGDYDVYGSNGIIGRHERPNTKAPCLIVGRKGSFGKVAYSEKPCFAIDTTYFIDSRFTRNDLRWLYYCLQWLRLDSFTKDSAVPGLAREDAYENLVPFCPEAEQRTIAAFLDRETSRIDTLIEKKQRQIELLQEKRPALISHAVTKGLNPSVKMKDSGIEWLGEIPEHWDIEKLKHISAVQFSNVDKNTVEGEEPVRLCNYVDVYYNEFITAALELMEATATQSEIQKFRLHEGDVLVTKDSEAWDDIAVPAYVTENHDKILCGYHLAQIRPNSERIDGKYLFRSFCSRGINDQFRVATTGITRYGLGKYWIDNGLFPVPPIDEQRAIAAFLDRETARIDTLIEKVKKSIDLLREYRMALISAAVTGKIDARKEVA